MSGSVKREIISRQVLALFSGDVLGLDALYQAVQKLGAESGIHSFQTPLPWLLCLSDGTIIQGDSENLPSAVNDISAHVHHIMATKPDVQAALIMDKTRIASPVAARGGV